jgi:sulfoquinovosidase
VSVAWERGRDERRRGPRAVAAVAGLAIAASLAGPAAAEAAVEVGPAEVRVSSAAGAAVVERSPFRMRFEDARGRTVLREVANERPAPLVQEPTPNAFPLGLQPVKGRTLYSPLSFVVGTHVTAQNQAGIYAGNQLAGLDGGVVHSARDVLTARAEAGAAVLELSTSDPTGRTLEVRIAPEGGGFRVSVRPSSSDGIAVIGDSFESGADEAFRGFGGRHNELDQRGNDFYNWIEQENVEPGNVPNVAEPLPGSGGDRYLFPNGPTAAYYVQSLFYSSRPYGFLLDRPELTRWRMASDREDAWQVSAAAAGLDYVVAPGPAPRAIKTLTRINGVHEQPPSWALGPQLDRSVQALSDTGESYLAKVRQDLEEIDRHDIPVSAYRIEGWLGIPEETLRELIDEFHSRGIKVTAYFKAFISRGDTLFDEQEAFDEALARGYFAKTPGGQPFLFNSVFGKGIAGLLDFTNPEAAAWYQQRVREALDLGFDGFMEDFGEQTQAQMVFANGETGQTMHNRYPVIYHRVTQELREAYERETGREVFSYVRAGFSGSPGSAAHEQANFPGDFQSTWGRANGIGASANDMLSRGVGGAVGYLTDIGGYLDTNNPATTEELLLRWAEWAALTPTFRLHNGAGTGTRMPWHFGEQAARTYADYARLHNLAVPLIERLWARAQKTGMPIARPLWLAFPGDAEAAKQDQQWMLGDDILVAPVVRPGVASREVYFPEGCWDRGNLAGEATGERYRGPREAEVAAPLGSLPYFVRCGTDPLAVKRCSNRVAGTGAAERLRGTALSDRVLGGRGDDRIAGRGGDDCLRGGPGRDRIGGGGGEDRIGGGTGADRLEAGPGDDRVQAIRGGRDRVDCGPGQDRFSGDRRDRVRRCEQVTLRE